MSSKQLRYYQEDGVNRLAQKLASGIFKVVFQMSTGSGKTVTFSAIADRYLKKNPLKSVLILVHRKELLQQTRREAFEAFKLDCQVIIAGMRHVPHSRLYVGMVESVNKRVERLPDIGLVIIDEAHRAEFNKMHAHFPDKFIIGFTATPLSGDKKKPMKDYYQDIVCGVDIPQLIAEGSLLQNITWSPKDIVEKSELKVKGGEYDTGLMAISFSKPKYIHNTVTAYQKWADKTKAIIFNCNIDHSKMVMQAFIAAGYTNCKHLDGATPDNERKQILSWFHTTPGAILCNCDVATTGFNEPTIETVVVNRSTMSMPLWLQMTGRGARPTPAMSMFTIIDMGGNALTHGDWSAARDWENIFFNPPKPGEGGGVAPVKNCEQCDAIIPAQCKTCPHCGYVYPTKEQQAESELGDFIAITKNINIRDLIQRNQHRKEYFTFYEIGRTLAAHAKNTVPVMNDETFAFILNKYHEKAQQWCDAKGIIFSNHLAGECKRSLTEALKEQFKKWKPEPEQPPPPPAQFPTLPVFPSLTINNLKSL